MDLHYLTNAVGENISSTVYQLGKHDYSCD